ncbi:IS110 family transposase [Mucilaginibacter robiniae]|uniref:IS110 family transposase n=1 Tax=Mucilaginibacter robiniae TaxID=2728022 RepID=A0A7L5E4A8_9SPHI|nr:IS110 family transposase [Mucilaginibacter robiniae]QJD98160.1 IS110 family transposase [Mucilaginibacter robiniae]
MKILKQSIGIDVSKSDFKVCLGVIDEQLETKNVYEQVYANDKKGINKFIKDMVSKTDLRIPVCFVMEATGVYHQQLAYALAAQQFCVVILLPNKAKSFSKSINIRAKSDVIDAKLLCQMGLERKLSPWQPPESLFATLKVLTREREALVLQRSKLKNQLHAYQTAFVKAEKTIARLKEHILYLTRQIRDAQTDRKALVKQSQPVAARINKITKVKGLSFLSVATILAETDGFNIILNQKQLVGYSGLDVQINQSGEKMTKGCITKKGNAHLRKALYMPALSACRTNPAMKLFYAQLNERQKAKKQGVIAVQRKLLLLTYSLWKTGQDYLEKCA